MMYVKILTFVCILSMLVVASQSRSNSADSIVGNKAPDFKLFDDKSQLHSLSEFKGKKVMLYFYPSTNTPTCTKQACGLRDSFDDLKKGGIEIIGITYNSIESLAQFKQSNRLPFLVLSDSDKRVSKKYHVNGWFNLFPKRITFLINESGVIVGLIKDIDIKNQAQQVLKGFGL